MSTTGKIRVTFVGNISTRMPCCHGATVVRVFGGQDRFHLKPHRSKPTGRELYFDDRLLAYGDATGCPTCEGMLRHGYGEGVMSTAGMRQVGDRLNAPYADARSHVEALAPLLGLLKSGCYILADCDQYPSVSLRGVKRGARDYPYDDFIACDSVASLDAFDYGIRFLGGWPESEYHTVPLFLWASQGPWQMSWDRVVHYMDVFSRDDGHLPRPIALYLNGAMSLVLDGHHKIAAAAMLGRPVRTTVIFRIANPRTVLTTLKTSGRVWFCSVGSRALLRTDKSTGTPVLAYDMWGAPPYLCDKTGMSLSKVCCWGDSVAQDAASDARTGLGGLCEGWRGKSDCEFLRKYRPRHDMVPGLWELVRGTRVDLGHVRESLAALRRACDQGQGHAECPCGHGWQMLRDLTAYKSIFPDAKWVSESELAEIENAL